MRRVLVELQLVITRSSSCLLCFGAALLVCLAAAPANAADSAVPSAQHEASKDEPPRGARVFSKDKPLFGQNQQIPSTTPDRSGNTKVKVIVKPSSPNAQTTAAEGTKKPSEHRSMRSSRQLDAYRADRKHPTQSGSRTANSQGHSSKVLLAKPRAENAVDKERNLSSLLPTANPKRLLASGSAHSEQSQVSAVKKVRVRRRARVARITKRKAKRRNRHARNTANRVRRGRTRYRSPYWRRFAPPGTVHSFVRCWPGEPCVRYYRVRRPRTLRQYRRLLAWQRHQDARLRYRRYYGRY